MSTGRDFSSERARLRTRPKTIGVLLILVSLSVLVAVVAMIALGALVLFTPVEEPVPPPQRKLVVDIRAVAAQIDDYVPEASRETGLRRRYFDGSFDIEYTYARGKHDDLYVQSTFAMTAGPAEAEKLFRRRWGLGPWSRTLPGGKDVALVERNDIFHWGDQSRLGVITSAGKPVGNLFVARRGVAVFSLLITGVCFDSAEAFSSLVLPTLTKGEGGRRKGEGRTKDKG
jgi:hypothetical protein